MKDKITRVCISGSIYTLFLYLLYSSEDELNHTYYFFSAGIAKSIREKFPNHYFSEKQKKKKLNLILKGIILFLSVFIPRYLRWPFLRKAEIFGHDHDYLPPFVIGKLNYTLIEDGPKAMSVYLKNVIQNRDYVRIINKDSFRKLLSTIISGVYWNSLGNNKQCKAIILSEDDDVPYTTGKIKHIIPLETTWKNISEEKKRYILNVFNISNDDIAALQSKTHIILAQQFSSDGFISEDDQINIYRKITEKYDPSCLLFKLHPRDSVDYRKYFPQVYVFDKPVPMQLLLLCGCSKYKKAITVCSSSINMFPDTVEKEWIGSSVHPALLKLYPNKV